MLVLVSYALRLSLHPYQLLSMQDCQGQPALARLGEHSVSALAVLQEIFLGLIRTAIRLLLLLVMYQELPSQAQ